MKHHLREYFSFTKKERTGILVLLLLILATAVIPYWLPAPPVETDQQAFEKLRQQVAQLEAVKDSGDHGLPYAGVEEKPQEPAALFAFDPNTLAVEDWKRLGLRERTARTIRHYVAKGGRFRQPEDLYKIYGLKKEEADRLVPYVRIKAIEPAVKPGAADLPVGPGSRQYDQEKRPEPAMVDINRADTTAFIALRGIGPKLAQRIVHFREQLGGFHSVEQIRETYGLPDSTFQQIRPLLHCPAPAIRTININAADVNLLQQHPYIRRPVANAIVQYREQHGPYQSIDQLLQINIVTPEIVAKIKPYLTVQ